MPEIRDVGSISMGFNNRTPVEFLYPDPHRLDNSVPTQLSRCTTNSALSPISATSVLLIRNVVLNSVGGGRNVIRLDAFDGSEYYLRVEAGAAQAMYPINMIVDKGLRLTIVGGASVTGAVTYDILTK